MTFNQRVLVSLGGGLAAGAILRRFLPEAAVLVSDVVAPVGSLWVNALLMLVMPLVLASLVVGVASAADLRAIGRLGRKTALIFLTITAAFGVFALTVAPPIMTRLTVDVDAAASVRSGSGPAPNAADVMTAGQWVASLLPANPVKAATEGKLLPLVIFALLFALALTQLPRPRAATGHRAPRPAARAGRPPPPLGLSPVLARAPARGSA